MPELLHEYWIADPDWFQGPSGCFGPVSQVGDQQLQKDMPGARFEHEIWASSFIAALIMHRKLAYIEEGTTEEFEEIPYTDEEFALQSAYLKVRSVVR